MKRVIFPLDGIGFGELSKIVRQIEDEIAYLKVGLEMFSRKGPKIVELIGNYYNLPVMLDLKLHDIPQTMINSTKVLSGKKGVDFLTVHASAGFDALKGVVEVTNGTNTRIVAVTLLTSIDEYEIQSLFYNPFLKPEDIVISMVTRAYEAGVRCFVCSPLEVGQVKKIFPDCVVICPGIRLSSSNDDQKRISTPEVAIENGADYLVIGRPIRNAFNRAELVRVINEI